MVLGLILGTAGVLATNALASRDNAGEWSGPSEEQRLGMEERRQAMTEIFENNDYQAWAEMMSERVQKMEGTINEETFSGLAEVHQLMQDGDFEGARQLREELGLNFHKGFGKKGPMPGERGGRPCPNQE